MKNDFDLRGNAKESHSDVKIGKIISVKTILILSGIVLLITLILIGFFVIKGLLTPEEDAHKTTTQAVSNQSFKAYNPIKKNPTAVKRTVEGEVTKNFYSFKQKQVIHTRYADVTFGGVHSAKYDEYVPIGLNEEFIYPSIQIKNPKKDVISFSSSQFVIQDPQTKEFYSNVGKESVYFDNVIENNDYTIAPGHTANIRLMVKVPRNIQTVNVCYIGTGETGSKIEANLYCTKMNPPKIGK